MPTPPDSSALRLWVVLARAYRAVGELSERDISRHGLTMAEFGVLEALYHKGPMLLGDLQRRILVSSGGITYVVDRLESKHLVARVACPEDRRARYAELTADGHALIGRIFPEHQLALDAALAGLSESEQARATALLRRLGLAAAELAAHDEQPRSA